MKSEIVRLNAWLQQENVGRIEAVKGQGYVLQPLDGEAFHLFREQVRSMDSMYFPWSAVCDGESDQEGLAADASHSSDLHYFVCWCDSWHLLIRCSI